MPFADPQRRREYDKERKQKQRAEGRTKKKAGHTSNPR